LFGSHDGGYERDAVGSRSLYLKDIAYVDPSEAEDWNLQGGGRFSQKFQSDRAAIVCLGRSKKYRAKGYEVRAAFLRRPGCIQTVAGRANQSFRANYFSRRFYGEPVFRKMHSVCTDINSNVRSFVDQEPGPVFGSNPAQFTGKPIQLVGRKILLPELNRAYATLKRLLDYGRKSPASRLSAIRYEIETEINAHGRSFRA
jgi:hypothetical protein